MIRQAGFYTTAAGGLGYALPAAVGVARACPKTRIIALLGDGSAMYTIQGLWSAAQAGADIAYVVLNNRRYAALDNFADRFGLGDLPGTAIEGIDFAAIAAGLGVASRCVADVDGIDPALAWAFATTGPTLIEFRI